MDEYLLTVLEQKDKLADELHSLNSEYARLKVSDNSVTHHPVRPTTICSRKLMGMFPHTVPFDFLFFLSSFFFLLFFFCGSFFSDMRSHIDDVLTFKKRPGSVCPSFKRRSYKLPPVRK